MKMYYFQILTFVFCTSFTTLSMAVTCEELLSNQPVLAALDISDIPRPAATDPTTNAIVRETQIIVRQDSIENIYKARINGDDVMLRLDNRGIAPNPVLTFKVPGAVTVARYLVEPAVFIVGRRDGGMTLLFYEEQKAVDIIEDRALSRYHFDISAPSRFQTEVQYNPARPVNSNDENFLNTLPDYAITRIDVSAGASLSVQTAKGYRNLKPVPTVLTYLRRLQN